MWDEKMKGRGGREGTYTSIYQTHLTALTPHETGNVSSHFLFFFFVHLNEEFGLRHSPQIMPPENRRYTKKRQLKLLTLKHVKNGKSSPPARYEQYTLQRRQSGGIAAFGVSR